MKNAKKVKIWCFIGPSGTGKTHLTKEFIDTINEEMPNSVGEIVSHTTRQKRKGEIDGKHYYFVNDEEFDKLEKVEQTCYAGNRYCISKKEVERVLSQYKKIFVVVEINGYKQLKEAYGDMVGSVFIKSPKDLLETRMILRGDKPEDVKKRLNHLEETNELSNDKYCDFVFENKWPTVKTEDIKNMFYCFCLFGLEILKEESKIDKISKDEYLNILAATKTVCSYCNENDCSFKCVVNVLANRAHSSAVKNNLIEDENN